MLPIKLIIFLKPNTKASKFEILNLLFSFYSLTLGINTTIYDIFEDADNLRNFSCFPTPLRNVCNTFKLVFASQISTIIVTFTFYIFFAAHGISMTDNFVQENYDKFGIWGETYSRDEL